MDKVSENGYTGELKFSTLVRAERERVFEAFATAEGWDSWFTQGTTMDPRPGGEFVARWRDWGVGRYDVDMQGKIVEVQPPERFVFRWWDMEPSRATTVETQFKQDPRGTVVRLRECGYPDTPAAHTNMLEIAAGWGEALTLMKFYIEHGTTY